MAYKWARSERVPSQQPERNVAWSSGSFQREGAARHREQRRIREEDILWLQTEVA
jgi:hypothetical protein